MRATALVLGVLWLAAAPAAFATPSLTLGFSGEPNLTGVTPADMAWIDRAVSEGAAIVQVKVNWSQVAPDRRPRGFRPSDPASPGYDWAPIDAAVRALSANGLQVLVNITYAPSWAEGRRPPRGVEPGTWRPDAVQLADFATAAAVRYDGRYPDPARPGGVLPRVRYWQAWNEPNLDFYLSPQWTRLRGRWAPASPAIYRQLLNAFYGAVKRVLRSNFVVMAGTAPYGDTPGGNRMQPVAFDRALFCLRGAALRPAPCRAPAHLDAVSHHPYGIGGPLWTALNADDAAVPDLHKIARVLHAAQRTGRVLPRGPKRLWVTEISWDSSPPDPRGVPIERHARWLEQALYVLWSQGVDTVLWLQLADSPPVPSYAASYQAGLYYLNGQPKPAATAFRFPFVTERIDRRRLHAWGRAPASGTLLVERLRARRWVVLRRLRIARHQVFYIGIPLRGRAVLRAQLGSQTSLSWAQGA